MKFFQEVTQWSGSTPNHVYYLTDDKRKMVGYIRAGTKRLHKFSQPMSFDSRGRKFVVLDRQGEPDEVYFPREAERQTETDSVQVQGSGGKVYHLTRNRAGWTCTCPGYMFRRRCRHVEEAQQKDSV